MTADGPVYGLNLFDIADSEEYLAYSRRSAVEVARHGGTVVALGRFAEAIEGATHFGRTLISAASMRRLGVR